MKNNKYNIKLFTKRFLAYFIDTLFISILSIMIASPFIDYKSISNLDNNSNQIMEDYMNEKITSQEFIDCSKPIFYRLYKHEGLVLFVSMILNVLYFVVYQFYNGGQTIGKRIFKIKIVNDENKLVTMNAYIFRTFIVNCLFINILLFILLLFANENLWFYSMISLSFLKFIIISLCGITCMNDKNGRGIHDVICSTKVINVEG